MSTCYGRGLFNSYSCDAITTPSKDFYDRGSRASSVLSNESGSPHRPSSPASMANYYSQADHQYSRMSSSRYSSRCTTPTNLAPDPMRVSRSPSPYSEMFISASRRQRKRSIPPPAPPPVIEPVSIKGISKPPMAPRVAGSEFYKGKVKSIYEREPLFKDFCRTVADKKYSMYNSEHLEKMKTEFKDMVEDKYKRLNYNDPSVGRDAGTKLYPWNNLLHKEREPASQRLGNLHSMRARQPSPVSTLPRITLYHKSTYKY